MCVRIEGTLRRSEATTRGISDVQRSIIVFKFLERLDVFDFSVLFIWVLFDFPHFCSNLPRNANDENRKRSNPTTAPQAASGVPRPDFPFEFFDFLILHGFLIDFILLLFDCYSILFRFFLAPRWFRLSFDF